MKEKQWTPGRCAAAGLVGGLPLAAVVGFLIGLKTYQPTAGWAALEGLVLFGWLGPLVGFGVGLVIEAMRPRHERRILSRLNK